MRNIKNFKAAFFQTLIQSEYRCRIYVQVQNTAIIFGHEILNIHQKFSIFVELLIENIHIPTYQIKHIAHSDCPDTFISARSFVVCALAVERGAKHFCGRHMYMYIHIQLLHVKHSPQAILTNCVIYDVLG